MQGRGGIVVSLIECGEYNFCLIGILTQGLSPRINLLKPSGNFTYDQLEH
jgi:hypothetical protein